MSFFARQDWAPLREEYAALLQRQQQVSGALQLARLDSEPLENRLTDSGVAALRQILGVIGTVDNFSEHWHLPAANPFLRVSEPLANAGLIRGQTSAHRGLRTFAQDRSRGRRERSPMQFSQALPDNGREGAVYLRWQSRDAEGRTSRLSPVHRVTLNTAGLRTGDNEAVKAGDKAVGVGTDTLQRPR